MLDFEPNTLAPPTDLNLIRLPNNERNWRELMGPGCSSWGGIGRRLGAIVAEALSKNGRSSEEIYHFLRFNGFPSIEHKIVEEYLSGSASFGCLFPKVSAWLGIRPDSIFGKNCPASQAWQQLERYLTEPENLECLVEFLVHKPGNALRHHVQRTLYARRDELICFDNGVVVLSKGRMAPQSLKDSQIEMAREFDYLVSGEDRYQSSSKSEVIGLNSWHEAYSRGTFSSLRGVNAITSLLDALQLSVLDLIPLKDVSAAARYEIAARFTGSGGRLFSGVVLDEIGEPVIAARRKSDEGAQPAYEFTSVAAIIAGLVNALPKMVSVPCA